MSELYDQASRASFTRKLHEQASRASCEPTSSRRGRRASYPAGGGGLGRNEGLLLVVAVGEPVVSMVPVVLRGQEVVVQTLPKFEPLPLGCVDVYHR